MLDLCQGWLLQMPLSVIFCSAMQIISLHKRRGAFCSTQGVGARMGEYFHFLNSCLIKNHLAGTGWQHSGCGKVEGVAELGLGETCLLT